MHEWNTSHVPSQLSHPDATQGRYEDIEEWHEQFIRGQCVSSLLEEMPELLRIDMAKVGVKAMYNVPIFIEGNWWGVLGFDDCREAKSRGAAELSVLKTAANCIGNAIQRDRHQQILLQAEQTRVTDLAKTTTALKNSLDRLAANPDLDAFLGYVTLEAVSQLGADAGHLTIFNEQRETLSTAVHVQQERIIPISPLATEMAICEIGAIQILIATRQPRFFDVEKESHLFWAGAVEYHQRLHHHRPPQRRFWADWYARAVRSHWRTTEFVESSRARNPNSRRIYLGVRTKYTRREN